MLGVAVHAANLPDSVGGRQALADLGTRFPRLRHLWADAGYRGSFCDWAQQTLQLEVEIVGRLAPPSTEPPGPHFVAAPRRWVVERTFAWLGRYRRMSKDYEALPETTRANIHIGMTRLMLARLAPS